MDNRLVEIEIDGRNKQLNPSNIAYIISRSDNIRFRGYVSLVTVFVLTVIAPVLVTEQPLILGLFGLFGVIVTYVIYRKMKGKDIQLVGTVNDSYDLSTQNINMIRSAFEDADMESLYIEGSQKTVFSSMDYSYYITPQNVVSIDHIDRSIPRIMTVGFVVLSVVIISFTAYSYSGIEMISGVSVGLTLLAVTTVFTISNRPDFIEIEFTNDTKKRVPLSKEKSEDVMKYFKGEKSLSELSKAVQKPELVEKNEDIKSIEGSDKKELE